MDEMLLAVILVVTLTCSFYSMFYPQKTKNAINKANNYQIRLIGLAILLIDIIIVVLYLSMGALVGLFNSL